MFNKEENCGNYLAENSNSSYIASVLKCAIARDIIDTSRDTAFVDDNPKVLEKLQQASTVMQLVQDVLEKIDALHEGETYDEQSTSEGNGDGESVSP